MNVDFIGSGIKKQKEEDILYLISKKVEEDIKKINPSINFKSDNRMLSDLCEIEDEYDDEIISVNIDLTIFQRDIKIQMKKFSYENEKIDIFVNIKSDEQYQIELQDNNIVDELLYDIKVCISRAVSKYMKEIRWINDEQNEEISKHLYSKVHNLENKFRGIINKYMLKKFGEEWFATKINESFKEKSKGYSEWYESRYRKLNYIKSDIFNLQTKDLILMLKNSFENENITKISKELNDIKGRLKEKSNMIIQENVLVEKNLWDKFFVPMFGKDIEEDWNTFSNMRNNIAHNKVLAKDFCKDMSEHIEKLNKIMNNANIKVDNVIKSLEDTMIRDYILQCDYEMNMDLLGYEIYNDDSDVVEKILEEDKIRNIYDVLEENINKIKSLYGELKETLNDIILEIDDEYKSDCTKICEFKNKLKDINTLVNKQDCELINSLIDKSNTLDELNSIGEMLSKLNDKLMDELEQYERNTDYTNEFEEKEICRFYNLDGEVFNIKINGWFTICAGSSDKMFIEYKQNEDEIATEIIEISFGDYSMHDDGYAMPEWEEGIYIMGDDVGMSVEGDTNNIIENLQSSIDNISKYI